MDSLIFSAFLIGIVSAVSLPLGALTSFVWRPDQRVIAALMAFGAGSLLAALTIDLVAVSLNAGHFGILAIGCIIGGILFIALDNIVSNYGGYRRKFSTTLHYRQIQNQKRLKATLSHLGRIEIFNNLSDDDINFLAHNIGSRFYAKGSSIFTTGDASSELYIIQQGSVELSNPFDQNESATTLSSGDAFGRAALFTGNPYALNARATTDCYISFIPKESLESLLYVSKEYREHVLSWLTSDEIFDYLAHKHNIDEKKIADWVDDVKSSFKEECILPDISEVCRNEDNFGQFAHKIERVSWLEELEDEEIEALGGLLVYKTFHQDEMLFLRGEPANYLYILHDGEVELKAGHDKNSLHKQVGGDGIGVRAFLCGLRHTVSARAVNEVKAWSLKRSDFETLLDKYPNFRLRVAFYIEDVAIRRYLEKRYNLNQAKIIHWQHSAVRHVKNGELPPSMLEMGIESTKQHGAALAIWLGILLDGIPESLVIGANMIHGPISISLVAGLFLSNYPEALSSSKGIRNDGRAPI